MALARVKTWNPGDVLTAADQNGEFNNILNNPISLVSPTTGPINFNLQAHTNLPITVVSGTSGIGGSLIGLSTAATPVPVWMGSAMQGSRVRGLQGNLTSQSGTFTADQYQMQSSSGLFSWTVTATSSFSASVGTAGPAVGGRDIAAAFGSTYVHWYAISTGPGSTAPAAIVSTATPPLGPVLPTGYTGWTYLGGSVYTSASTTVANDHVFRGDWAFYNQQIQEVFNGNTTAETPVSFSTFCPPNAKETQHSFQTLIAPGNGQLLIFRHTSLSVVAQGNYWVSATTNSAVTGILSGSLRLPNVSNQLFYLYSSQLASAADGLLLSMNGYRMPNGDG